MGKRSDTCPRFIWVNKRVGTISEAVFAPGYHFCPNDNDLLTYLRNKNMKQDLDIVDRVIKVIDVYKHLPGELLKTYLPIGEQELYFFCPVTMKYLSGLRIKRSSEAGNWRITGRDRKLYGMLMRTLVFYDSEHKRTNWIMHEYRLEDKELSEKNQKSEVNYVLCKLYEKSEPNVKDSQQAGAFEHRESNDRAYCDMIVIIPESLISNLSGMKCLPMNASVLSECLQSSADNGSNTPNVLQNTDKVNYVLRKTYEKTKLDVEDSQKDGAFSSEIEMKDDPEPFISKLFGSECLPMNASIQGESLQSSTDHDNKTPGLLGNIDKLDSFEAQILPNKVQTSEDMALEDVETRVVNDPPMMQENPADHGMHADVWDSSNDFNSFDNLFCGRMVPDWNFNEFGWFDLLNVKEGNDIHMEDLSGSDINDRMSSDMNIDEPGRLPSV